MRFEMNVTSRRDIGKGAARALRRAGKIPGILYGQKESLPLTIAPDEVRKILHSESGANALLNLHISGAPETANRTAMLRDYQLDPVTGAILHADLFEVAMEKPVRVRVPVVVTEGTPVGVAEGGVLQHNARHLRIECLPAEIPGSICVDPTSLRINQGIHVKEIMVPGGIRILDDPEMMVVSVIAPISEAKLEALLSTTPAGEGAAEPEVIGKKVEEEIEEPQAGVKAAAKVPVTAAPGSEVKEEKKEAKEVKKEVKGEKKK